MTSYTRGCHSVKKTGCRVSVICKCDPPNQSKPKQVSWSLFVTMSFQIGAEHNSFFTRVRHSLSSLIFEKAVMKPDDWGSSCLILPCISGIGVENAFHFNLSGFGPCFVNFLPQLFLMWKCARACTHIHSHTFVNSERAWKWQLTVDRC